MTRTLCGIALLLMLIGSGPLGAQGVLYEEDFDDGVADGFVFTGDPWWVAHGYLRCYSKGYALLSMGYVPGASWSDYTYEVDLQVFGSINQLAAFRVQNEGNYYEVNVRADPYNDAYLQKYVDGQMTVLASVNVSTQVGEWHHYEIEVSGPRIDVWLDSAPLLTHVDVESPYLWGGVGVVCFTGGVIQWQQLNVDNVRVTIPSIPVAPTTWSRIKSLYR